MKAAIDLFDLITSNIPTNITGSGERFASCPSVWGRLQKIN